MKRLVITLALPVLFATGSAFAESPVTGGVGINQTESSYEQALRQSRDVVRAKAELKAEQRLRRLESMRWFGFSNSRPQVQTDPFDSDYAPKWVANPGVYPARWGGVVRQ